MKTDRNLKEFLTTDEVAEVFGISRDTVYRWIKAKSLPAKRLGKRMYRQLLPDLDQFIAGQETNSIQEAC